METRHLAIGFGRRLRHVVALLGAVVVITTPMVVSGKADPAAAACVGTTAPSTAEATELARSCGRAIEVAGSRTETDLVYALPNGKMRLERHARPVRTRTADGGWASIDTTLRVAADGSVSPVATPVALRFSGGDGPLVEMRSDGQVLSVGSPFGTLPKPRLEGSDAVYPDVLPGVDLKLTAHAEGYTEVLIVKDRQAAKHPALRKVSFPMSGPGLTTTVDGAGNVRVVDEAGTPAFVGSRAAMWDSSSTPASAAAPAPGHVHAAGDDHQHAGLRVPSHAKAMPTEVAGPEGKNRAAGVRGRLGDTSVLSIQPSQEFLQDPATVYPVMIDPPVTRYKNAWTYVAGDCGTCNFLNSSENAQTGPINGHGHFSYFRMSMADLGGKNVVSAYFVTDLLWTAASYWKETDLYWVGAIGSGTTWNNRPGLIHNFGTVTVNAPTNGITWNITGRIQEGAAAWWPDITLGLIPWSQTDWAFGKEWSNNPRMVVDWNDAPGTPTPLAFDASCSGAGCASPAYVRTTQPKLRATIADPNGGQLRADFEVRAAASDTGALLGSITSGNVASGSTAEWTLPSGMLTNGSTAYWRVRGRDEYDWVGGWSAFQQVTVDTSAPSLPSASSPQYPALAWGAPAGTTGQFTFTQIPPGVTGVRISDVVKFVWWVDGQGGTNTVAATMTPGCETACAAQATVSFTPAKDMAKVMHVQAIDYAGNTSPTFDYVFKVSSAPNRCWRWLLNETSGTSAADSGNTDAADEICGPLPSPANATVSAQNGTLATGASFVTETTGGARQNFARLNGSSAITMPSSVIDTTKSFTVMAWARPASLTGYETLISQDGASESRFALRYSKDANGGTGGWCASLRASDTAGAATTLACATGAMGDSVPPAANQWVHLAAVYDAVNGTLAIHVMGNQASCNGEEVVVPAQSTWSGVGPLVLGRALGGGGPVLRWNGDIDHVYVHQRALETSEICRQVI